jgi:septal ring factor EnvC (AmiA/AmiB activator)
MINLCTDPTCDENAALTIQRQIDVAPVGFCLTHGYQREAELKQRLENYTLVTVVQQAPTELELAQARIAELEEKTDAGELRIGDDDTAEQQLETALRTLEQQGKVLERTRAELAESKEAFNVARRELDRTRSELERLRAERRAERTTEHVTTPAPRPGAEMREQPPSTKPDTK